MFMMNRIVFAGLMLFLMLTKVDVGAQAIVVADLNFKTKSSTPEEFYYAFAENDVIVIDFSVVGNSTIKSFELIELPSNTVWSVIKQNTISQKKVQVPRKGVFLFRVDGGTLGKECNLKISRIPQNVSTEKFNTAWTWKILSDTIYKQYEEDSLVGYDTLKYKESVKEEVSSHMQEVDLLPGGKPVTIKSSGIIVHDIPRQFVRIALPMNEESATQTKKVIAWAYWIGVGSSAESFFSKNMDAIANTAIKASGVSNPIAGWAIGVVADLIVPSGESIDPVGYAITDSVNKNYFMKGIDYFSSFDKGFGKGGVGRFTQPERCQGVYYVCMKNENIHDRIDVVIKAIAVVEIKEYQNKEYDCIKLTPRYVTLHKKRMVVNATQVRVPIE